jgi:Flp pilus assembly protein TadD
MNEMDKYYQILGLNPGASEEEIKQAYKDLVKVWHPDRFSDPRLKEKANEKLKEINFAYEKLKSYIAGNSRQYASSEGNYAKSQPPPHEPPPNWEKEQSSTTESGGYKQSGPPPNEPPLEANEEGAIWNPNAAANWSILFTPAFGSYLQMLNWRTLNESAKASSAQSWFYASLLMLFICFLIGTFVSDREDRYIILWWLSFPYLITWYLAAGRSQGKYVKAKFGTNYPKKPWGRALLVAAGALIGCWVVAFALGFIFRAMTTKDNIHTAMENELEKYRVKDQPQDDLEKYRVARTDTVAKISEVTIAMSTVASAVVAYHEDLSSWPLCGDAIAIQTSLGVSIPENIIRSISITSPTADQVTITAKITGIDSTVDGKALILRGKFTAKQGVLFMWDGTVPSDYIPKPPKPSPQTSEVTAVDWYNRGHSLLSSGNHRDAVNAFSRAIELKPNFADAYYLRGVAYDKLGNYLQAMTDYDKAIEINPYPTMPYLSRGIAFERLGDYLQAIKNYDKAIEVNNVFEMAYLYRGNAYFNLKDYQQAIKDFDRAIKINPKYAEAYYGRGNTYSYLGLSQNAIDDLKIAAGLGFKKAQNFLRSKGIEW